MHAWRCWRGWTMSNGQTAGVPESKCTNDACTTFAAFDNARQYPYLATFTARVNCLMDVPLTLRALLDPLCVHKWMGSGTGTSIFAQWLSNYNWGDTFGTWGFARGTNEAMFDSGSPAMVKLWSNVNANCLTDAPSFTKVYTTETADNVGNPLQTNVEMLMSGERMYIQENVPQHTCYRTERFVGEWTNASPPAPQGGTQLGWTGCSWNRAHATYWAPCVTFNSASDCMGNQSPTGTDQWITPVNGGGNGGRGEILHECGGVRASGSVSGVVMKNFLTACTLGNEANCYNR